MKKVTWQQLETKFKFSPDETQPTRSIERANFRFINCSYKSLKFKQYRGTRGGRGEIFTAKNIVSYIASYKLQRSNTKHPLESSLKIEVKQFSYSNILALLYD